MVFCCVFFVQQLKLHTWTKTVLWLAHISVSERIQQLGVPSVGLASLVVNSRRLCCLWLWVSPLISVFIPISILCGQKWKCNQLKNFRLLVSQAQWVVYLYSQIVHGIFVLMEHTIWRFVFFSPLIRSINSCLFSVLEYDLQFHLSLWHGEPECVALLF